MRTRMTSAVFVAVVVLALTTSLFNRAPGADATQGQPVIAGVNNSSESGTSLWADRTVPGTVANTSGLDVLHYADSNDINPVGVSAYTGDPGPWGIRNVAIGVWGRGSGDGVVGEAKQNGVLGRGVINGVQGVGGNGGTGVFGTHTGGTGIGVWGQTGGTGSAVYGEATANGIGVFGDSTNGTGVQARSTTGPALNVLGRAQFSLSGIAVVKADRASVTVSNVALTNSSLVLALIQGNVQGTWVRGVVLDIVGDKLTIRLNKVVSNAAFVGWFVVD